MQLTRSEKHIAEQMEMVIFIRAKDMSGSPTYFYVAVQADKLPAFRAALAKGNTDPDQFGTVLEWGYGRPSDALKKHMAEKYGCKHDAAVSLIKSTKQE